MKKKLFWREVALLCVPAAALGMLAFFPAARNLLPFLPGTSPTFGIVAPNTLERYQGYNAAIEVDSKERNGAAHRSKAAFQGYAYEFQDPHGKPWSSEKLDRLEVFDGGLISFYEGRFFRASHYHCAFMPERIFHENGTARFSIFEQEDEDDTAAIAASRRTIRLPDFNLAPLTKPDELPFRVSKVQWTNQITKIGKRNYYKGTVRVWVDQPTIDGVDFLRDWHFYDHAKPVGHFGHLGPSWGKDQQGASVASFDFLFDEEQKGDSAIGRLSINHGWPVEVTVHLPVGWETVTTPMDLKFEARPADLPTAAQLNERNDWLLRRAQGSKKRRRNYSEFN